MLFRSALRVRSIDTEPFPFSFDGVKMKGADGAYKFTIRGAAGRDWYVKKGQELSDTGFILKDYSSVVEERRTSTGIRKVEVFSLVFDKNGEQVVMTAGAKPEVVRYKASLVCGNSAAADVYEVYLNDSFDFDGDTLKLISVNRDAGTARLERASNREVLEIPAEEHRAPLWGWN